MFCCPKKSHEGEIITSICQQQQCISSSSQLVCSECMRQQHSSHATTSMKKIMPELLMANNQRKVYCKLLEDLACFVQEEFAQDQMLRDIIGTGKIGVANVVHVVKAIMVEMRKVNKQENKKLKEIQKTLKINSQAQNRNNSPGRSLLPNYQSMISRPNQLSKLQKNYESVPLSSSIITSIETFSHSLKHPYITVSPDMRSVFKSSQAGGYKLAALSSAPVPSDPDNVFFNIKVAKSTGNILLGLAIPEIVKDKEYLNCYGAGHGTYLMGQNGNDPASAIIFHHTDNVYNRKEIVGWNYKQGETLGIGIIKQEQVQLVSFRKYHNNSSGKPDPKKVHKQFAMPLWPKGVRGQHRLHIIAILQSLNDQVQFVPTQE